MKTERSGDCRLRLVYRPDARQAAAIRAATFRSQRSGYDPGLVEVLLVRLAEAFETGGPIDPPLDSIRLRRKSWGYRRSEVDRFLAALRGHDRFLAGLRPVQGHDRFLAGLRPVQGPAESMDLVRESAQKGHEPTADVGAGEGQPSKGTGEVAGAEVPTRPSMGSEAHSTEAPLSDVDLMLARLRAEADAFVEAEARRAGTRAAEIIAAANTEAATMRYQADKIEERAQARAAAIEALAAAITQQALNAERSLAEASAEIATARQAVTEPGSLSISSIIDLTDRPVELDGPGGTPRILREFDDSQQDASDLGVE